MQNTYKSKSVNLYVIPRDNSANKFYTTGMDTAVSRCNSALNSDMMKELIKRKMMQIKCREIYLQKYRNRNKCHCDECNEQFG